MKKARFIIIAGIALCLSVSACGGNKKADSMSGQQLEEEVANGGFALRRAAMNSQFDPAFVALSGNSDAAVRADLALTLGRIRADKGVPILKTLLSDGQSEVRAAAAFAAGQMHQTAAELFPLLTTRLKNASFENELEALLFALSRMGEPYQASLTVAGYLQDKRARIRAAAAHGLGILAGRATEQDIPCDALCGVLADADAQVRTEAAAALSRFTGAALQASCIADLHRLMKSDTSSEVRIQAARASIAAGVLNKKDMVTLLSDIDYRVPANVLSFVGNETADARCAVANAVMNRVSDDLKHHPTMETFVLAQPLRAALLAAQESCPTDVETVATARALVDQLGNLSAKPIIQARCLAAALGGVDDLDVLACDPAGTRLGKKTLTAKWASKPLTELTREALLELLKDSDPAAAVDALHVLAKQRNQIATRTVLRMLQDERPLLQSAALLEIRDNPDLVRNSNAQEDNRDAPTEARNAILSIFNRFREFEHAFSPLQAAADALGALGDDAGAALLTELIRDTRLPVREAAVSAFQKIPTLKLPAGLPPLILPEEGERALTSLRPNSDVTAIFQFEKADVTATLFRDIADLTTAGFAFAARSEYYADTSVYRAVPGEAVFLGDPTGTGLGDPGWYTPAEPAPVKVERGSLVVANTGTSAGLGRFFIALRRMPELDGIATVFGRVMTNLDFLDSLDESDTLIQVHISEISRDEE